MNNFKFWWSKIIKYLKNIEYSTLTIHSKQPIFPQINEGVTKQGDFLFSKILQLLIKRVTGGLFDYYGIVPKEVKPKIRRSSS